MRKLASFLALAVLAGCAEEPTPPDIDPATIQLTGAQASLISSRVALAVTGNTDLGWLADSVDLVVTSGATAKRISVTTNFGVDAYYAVSLKREHEESGFSWSTFDLIAFDDAADPTHFLIVGGYKSSTGAAAPSSVSGTFDGDAVHAWLFENTSAGVRTWHATGGTAGFTDGAFGGACVGFPDSPGATCTAAELQVSMDVTATEEPGADFGEARSASMATAVVPGILISFE